MFSFSRKFFFSCKKKKNWIIAYTLHVHKSKDCEYFDLYRNTRSRGTHCQVQRYVYTRRPFAISCNYERVSFSSSTPIMRINEASFLRKSASTWPHIIVRSCVSCNTGRVFSFFFLFTCAHPKETKKERYLRVKANYESLAFEFNYYRLAKTWNLTYLFETSNFLFT